MFNNGINFNKNNFTGPQKEFLDKKGLRQEVLTLGAEYIHDAIASLLKTFSGMNEEKKVEILKEKEK